MNRQMTTWAIYLLGVVDGIVTVRHQLTLFPSLCITLFGSAIASIVHLLEKPE